MKYFVAFHSPVKDDLMAARQVRTVKYFVACHSPVKDKAASTFPYTKKKCIHKLSDRRFYYFWDDLFSHVKCNPVFRVAIAGGKYPLLTRERAYAVLASRLPMRCFHRAALLEQRVWEEVNSSSNRKRVRSENRICFCWEVLLVLGGSSME